MTVRRALQLVAGTLLLLAVATLAHPMGNVRALGGRFELAGLPLSTYQNLLLLGATVLAAAVYGVRRRLNPILAAVLLLFVMSFTVSSRLPQLSAMQTVRTSLALALAPLLFEVRLPEWVATWLRRLVPWLALGHVALSYPLILWFDRSIHRSYLGAFRLAGTLVPAALAMLAIVALMFCLLAARRQPRWIWLAAVNFGVIVWTGTRSLTLAGVILCFVWIVSEALAPAARSRLRDRVALGLLVPAILLTYAPFIVARSTNFWEGKEGETVTFRVEEGEGLQVSTGAEEEGASTDGEGDGLRFTMTGRIAAWKFYFGLARENLWFGRGVGAGIVGSADRLDPSFQLPHNEYLRFLVDGGVVGLAAMLLAHGWVLLGLFRGSRPVRLLVLAAAGVLAFEAMLFNVFATQPFIIPFWLYLAFLTREEEPAPS